jgi:hypothetical protein
MKTISEEAYEKVKDVRYKLLERLVATALGGDYEKNIIHSGDPMREGSKQKFDFYWDRPLLSGGVQNDDAKVFTIQYDVYIRGLPNNTSYAYSNLVELVDTLAAYGFKADTFMVSQGATYTTAVNGWEHRKPMPETGYLVIGVEDTKFNVKNKKFKPKPSDIDELAAKADAAALDALGGSA